MAALSWDEIVERGKQHNKTVICEVEKRGSHRNFKIKCNICGDEKIKVLTGMTTCKKCHYSKLRGNNEKFIFKAKNKHGDKYDYNLVEYINSETKVKIKCNTCNTIFEQIPYSHLSGCGCPKCYLQKYTSNVEEFIFKAKNKHEDKYDYSLVEYVNAGTKVKIKCNTCNTIFGQIPNSHLSGIGCRKCFFQKYTSNVEEFIFKAKNKHGDKYDYSLVEYVNAGTKSKIKCKSCNNIFEQKPNSHLSGIGCPKCKESKGEIKVTQYLTKKNISFIPKKTFKTLRDKNPLFPDFYLDDHNLLIEYDGEGHYFPCFGSTPEEKQKNLEDCQRRDKIKNEWAKANNIPLLRIPYWDFDRIEELIEAFILQHTKKKEIKQLVLEM
jgi:hypothetical protein